MSNTNRGFICVLSVILFNVVVIAAVYNGSANAGDGDVNYSAPYIIFDPETGKLITVNPGPELRMHDNVPATSTAPADVDSLPANPSDITTVRSTSPEQIPVDTAGSIMVLITGGVIAFVLLAGWYMRKRHTGRPKTKSDFVGN